MDVIKVVHRLYNKNEQCPTTSIKIYGNGVPFIIDTGTNLNIISNSTYNQLKRKPKLRQSIINAYGFNAKSPIPILGEFDMTMKGQNRQVKTRFLVLDGNADNLLGFYATPSLNYRLFDKTPY